MKKRYLGNIAGILVFCILSGCKESHELFTPVPASRSGIDFDNSLSESDTHNILTYLYYYNGGGVAIADFNQDGLEDVFFAGNEVSCKLYLNKGNLEFDDITSSAGLSTDYWATGVTVVDINTDGFPDLYVSAAGYNDATRRANKLYINQGSSSADAPIFVEQAEAYGIADTGFTTQSAFIDYDKDGLLDLYVMNHSNDRAEVNTPVGRRLDGTHPSQDRLYRNLGNGKFENVSSAAGILSEGYGLGLSIGDFNQDGWPDIYVANDFIYNDLLYINQQNGTFVEQSTDYLAVQTYNSMGCDLADVNNDGLQDMMVLDMLPPDQAQYRKMAGSMTYYKFGLMEGQGYAPQYMRNTLQMNTGAGVGEQESFAFAECGRMAGVSATDWSWSALFADWNNDAHKDLYVTNGYRRDITDKDFADYTNSMTMFTDQAGADTILLAEIRKRPGLHAKNACFLNNGKTQFDDITANLTYPKSYSNGAAWADLDKDGDLDLIINNIGEPAFLLQNHQSSEESNNYIQLQLKGPSHNPTGIGAKIVIQTAQNTQTFYQYPVRGFMSHVSEIIHAGLGPAETIKSIQVWWPDGRMNHLSGVTGRQQITVQHSESNEHTDELPASELPMFIKAIPIFEEQQKIQNSASSDFYTDKLIHKSYSNPASVLKVGDLNQDGLEDVLYCPNGSALQIALQTHNGGFQTSNIEIPVSGIRDAMILDYNGDGWSDIWLLKGANLQGPDSSSNLLILLNNQLGNFSPESVAKLPQINAGNCLLASTARADGSRYIFMGSSFLAGKYPEISPPQLWLLKDAALSDVSQLLNQPQESTGLITAASWVDMDGDGTEDLVTAGHWMSPAIYYHRSGTFEKQILETSSDGVPLSGWWNTLYCADLDQNGLPDILLGNEGLNGRYPVDANRSIRLYYDDFDKNGKLDPILALQYENRFFPIHSKDEIKQQLPGLANRYPRHEMFVREDIEQLFNKDRSQKLTYLEARQMASLWLRNRGSGQFDMHLLPAELQQAPLQDFVSLPDSPENETWILALGNAINAEITTGYQLGYNPCILRFSADSFELVKPASVGIYLKDVQKRGAILSTSDRHMLLIASGKGALRTWNMRTDHLNKFL